MMIARLLAIAVSSFLAIACGSDRKRVGPHFAAADAEIYPPQAPPTKEPSPSECRDGKRVSAILQPGYEEQIRPIMDHACVACHSSGSPAGGVALDRRVPEGASDSAAIELWQRAYDAVRDGRMPPQSSVLSTSEVELIGDWIEQGMRPSASTLAVEVPAEECSDDTPPPSSCGLDGGLVRALAAHNRLLSKREYLAAIDALFPGTGITTRMSQHIDLIPVPSRHAGSGFDTTVAAISPQAIEAYMSVSEQIAIDRTGSETALGETYPCLASAASGPLDMPCLDGFILDLGRKAFRRALAPEEAQSLRELFLATDPTRGVEGLTAVLSAILQSPSFLYLLELGDETRTGDDVFRLSPSELAAKLSFLAWGTPPDATLRNLAASGEILEPEVYEAEVERLFADAQARRHAMEFFDQWLGLRELPPFKFYSYEFLSGLDNVGLRPIVVDELKSFLYYTAFERGGAYRDLLTSSDAFISDDRVAKVYGVPMPRDPGSPVDIGPQRAGILTRMAFLSDGRDETSPVFRGRDIRKMILCDELSPPSAAALPPDAIKEPHFDPNKTSRLRWHEQTSGPACSGCHNKINPLGFALEEFDAIGRQRTHEKIFDLSRNLVNILPVDTFVYPLIEGSDDSRAVTGGVQLSHAIAESEKGPRCFARQWFRFAMGRREQVADACIINDLVGQPDLVSMFKYLANMPAFQYRTSAPR